MHKAGSIARRLCNPWEIHQAEEHDHARFFGMPNRVPGTLFSSFGAQTLRSGKILLQNTGEGKPKNFCVLRTTRTTNFWIFVDQIKQKANRRKSAKWMQHHLDQHRCGLRVGFREFFKSVIPDVEVYYFVLLHMFRKSFSTCCFCYYYTTPLSKK